MATQTQTREIRVRGIIQGDKDLKNMANALGSVAKSAKNVESSFSSLKNLASNVAGVSILGFGVRELTGIADSMTQLTSKLDIFVGGGEKAKQVFNSLAQIADDTKAPIQAIATIFTRLAVATERLNLSSGLQLAITRTLQQSFRVSGATAEEATGSTIQFAQALAFGQLRGQELRSVLSQNAVLAGVFNKAIEGSGKSIYKFAEAGGFTTKFVLTALLKNMNDIESKAGKLSQTFAQTLTIALNKLALKIKDINESFNLNGNFAAFVDFIIDKGPSFNNILTVIAVSTLPKLTASMASLIATMVSGAGAATALTGLLGALTVAAIYTAGGFHQFVAEAGTLIPTLSLIVLQVTKAILAIGSLGTTLVIDNPISRFLDSNIKNLQDFIKFTRDEAKKLDEAKQEIAKPVPLSDLLKEADKIKVQGALLTIKEQIGALNTAFEAGKVPIDSYITKIKSLEIQELERKLNKGIISLYQFNEGVNKVNLEDANRQFEIGAATLDDFKKATLSFNIQELNEKFRRGKIDVEDYNKKLRELKIQGMDQDSVFTGMIKGLNDFSNSVGTTAEAVAKGVESTFDTLGDAIFQATKTGKLDFATMTQSILDDITKIAIRLAIVKPLSEGLLGSLFGPSTSGGAGSGNGFGNAGIGQTPIASVQANGGVWSRGVQKFATGGVVSSPTYFGMTGGRTGLMGEAGPEAIVPLKRSSNGALGVSSSPINFTVINNTSSEVSTRESTTSDGARQIEVIIDAKVREGLSNGKYDKQMKQNFGVGRIGN